MENVRYNHHAHAQTTLTWLLVLTQGSDIFGNSVHFSEDYPVCMEKKGNHSSELHRGIAADAADIGVAKSLFQTLLFTRQAAVSLPQVLPHC